MLSNFEQINPDVLLTAAEKLGGQCTGRFLALNAMENRVYQVEMEETGYIVIKFYRPGRWPKETIQAEHDFLKALEEAEIPVVRPLTDEKQESIFEINGVFFTLFPKRPGRLEPELKPEQLKRLGRFLARLHNVGATKKDAPRWKLTPQLYGRDSLKFIEENKLISSSFAIRYRQLVTEICDMVEPWFEGIEYLLLHGDCHHGNILWREDEPYFIDFDDMLYAPPVQDCWMLTGADDSYGLEMRKTLLEAYEEIREFDYTTLKLIEPLRTLRMIYFTAWIARRWEDGAFKMAFNYFGTERYWQEQIEGLSGQLEKIRHRESSNPYS